jgi:5-methylcytosine-specific restriction endonuclease McrA
MPPGLHRDLFRRDRKVVVAPKHPDAMRWSQFVRHICADFEIKRELSRRQRGYCEFCRKPFIAGLDEAVVHHLSYDYECTRIRSNVLGRPKCGDCLREYEQAASRCLERLRLLHTQCHKKLHRMEAQDPEWRASVGLGPPDD